jgi:hypothetical protein
MSHYPDSAKRCDNECVVMFGNFSMAQSPEFIPLGKETPGYDLSEGNFKVKEGRHHPLFRATCP